VARETWTADGWTLTDGLVRDVELREGLLRTAGLRGGNSVNAAGHGETWQPKKLAAGGFVLNMWLGEATRTQVEAAFDNLLRAVAPVHRLVRYRRGLAGGSFRQCDGEVVQAIEPVPVGQLGMRMGIEVLVPSGAWEDVADVLAATAAGGALPQSLSLGGFAAGTAPMDALLVTVNGPLAGGWQVAVVTDTGVDGDSFRYGGNLAAGQSMVLNTATWAVTGGGGFVPNLDLLTWSGPRYLTIPTARPGANCSLALRSAGGGGGAGTGLSVSGRRRYLA